MDIEEIVRSIGLPGVGVVAFISATIFPLSSEAAVFGAIKAGLSPISVLLFASIGNCLGVLLNYGLGRWGSEPIRRKSMKSKKAQRALAWIEKHGLWTLWLSWLPFIGDPITLVAGIARVNFLHFALIAFSLRIARYIVVILLMA